ncbi:MAG: hypothetical protein IPM46_14255 [Flavobacteriales bacterium]|nr:hypothetical protein [Flavobacteriales bacterium]
MRIILSILALAFVVATASAQTATTEKKKKNRKVDKIEAVSVAPEAVTPKAACCAGKASASKAGCAGKGDVKADAMNETVPVDAAATVIDGAAEGAPKAACCANATADKSCCAGKAKADKGNCHGKAEAHSHEDTKTEEAPAATPNQ